MRVEHGVHACQHCLLETTRLHAVHASAQVADFNMSRIMLEDPGSSSSAVVTNPRSALRSAPLFLFPALPY